MNKTYTNINQIVKSNGYDAHAWVEDEDGVIYDYDAEVLNLLSSYGKKCVSHKRVPFPTELQLEFLPYFKKYIDKTNKLLPLLTEEQKGICYNKFMNCGGACFYRAYLIKGFLKDKENKKSKVVIGSLGYIQPNGDIYYEYG